MSKKQPIKNATKVIERFGGIRPMAAKIDTPVTTVQGWKKRDVIPGTRRDQIMKAADELNIDLSDINENVANQNEAKTETQKPEAKKDLPRPKTEEVKKSSAVPVTSKLEEKTDGKQNQVSDAVASAVEATRHVPKKPTASASTSNQDDILAAIEANNRKTLARSAWIAVGMILMAAFVIFFLFKPSIEQQNAQQLQMIKEQEEEIQNLKAEVENRTGFIENVMPDGMQAGLQERMNGLQNQARNIQITVEQLAERADEISSEISSSVLGPDAGPLAQRIEMLEEKMSQFSTTGNFGDLVERIGTLEGTMMGQDQLKASVQELQDIVTNMDNTPASETLNENLEEAQNEGEGSALSQTLQGVSGNDLKAAAMLIAFSQLRDSLNREAPFENDLELLEKLVDEDNTELQGAIDRLAPHADGGVLTAKGLSGEFKGLTGDILEASLKGEDISFTERAKARLGNLMSIEKDGELVGATDTQQTVNKAQQLLDEGNIQAAIAELQTLEGPAAEEAQPFIQQAEISLLAERVQEMMGENILSNITNQIPSFNTERSFTDLVPELEAPENLDINNVRQTLEEAVPNMGGNEVIRDEESGVTILPRQPGFKGFSSGAQPTR
jgi:hypothetical protein